MKYTEHRDLALELRAQAVDEIGAAVRCREEAGSFSDCEGYEEVTRFCRLTDEADWHYRRYRELTREANRHMGIYRSHDTRIRNRREAARQAVMGW